MVERIVLWYIWTNAFPINNAVDSAWWVTSSLIALFQGCMKYDYRFSVRPCCDGFILGAVNVLDTLVFHTVRQQHDANIAPILMTLCSHPGKLSFDASDFTYLLFLQKASCSTGRSCEYSQWDSDKNFYPILITVSDFYCFEYLWCSTSAAFLMHVVLFVFVHFARSAYLAFGLMRFFCALSYLSSKNFEKLIEQFLR